MKDIKNLSIFDRMLRIIFAEIFFIIGYFWIGGTIQILVYVLSFVFLLTGLVGYCGIYRPLGINTLKNSKDVSKVVKIILSLFFVLIAVFGSYYSVFFTKKIFLEDYNIMNNYYKQALFNTGKANREESISNYNLLTENYKIFSEKYMNYKPYVLKKDELLNYDLKNISFIIYDLKEEIYNGDLQKSHLELEKVRPVFQEILKRNGFSMLAVTLVDFHDVMEKVIDAADVKDVTLLDIVYAEADEKLKAVEVEANDEEIMAIRKSLDEVKSLADSGELDKLSDIAQELKTNFIKVYLKRG